MGLHEGIPGGDHKARFTIDLNSTTYFKEIVQPSSRKSNKNNTRKGTSLGENRKAPSDKTKVKRKDIFEGENLFEVPKDGGLEFFPITQEKSAMLIEDTIEVNTDTPKNTKMILLATSLIEKERPEFQDFFTKC